MNEGTLLGNYFRILCWLGIAALVFPPLAGQPSAPGIESYGDQLVIGILKDKNFTLNPFQIYTPAQKEILQLIFGYGLTKTPDKVLNPPDLIERYLTTPGKNDPRVWRILLDRNISFHDGSNLRNVDVKFTFEMLKKYRGFILNRRFDFDNIKSISCSGDLEVRFELFEPDENFGAKLADIPIVPGNYYQAALRIGPRVFEEKEPVGMGPFILESFSQNMMNLRFHPHYYSGRPFLDRVKVLFFPDEQALIDALVNGQVDYIEFSDPTTLYRIRELMGQRMALFPVPRPETKVYTMLFNLTRFPFSEPEVRQAVNLALNRQDIVNRFMKDVGKVANTLLPESSPYYERSLYREEYDPQEALTLMTGAGWRLNKQSGMLEKNGQPLSFNLYFTRHSHLEENVARAIKIYLAELNMNVEPIPVAPDDKETLVRQGAYQSLLFAYTYDPRYLFEAFDDFFFNILGAGLEKPNYQNRYLNRLFSLVREKAELHRNIYQRFQTFAVRENPAIFLFFDERILVGLNSRFREFRAVHKDERRFYYRMNPVENWFVPKELQKY